MMGRAARRMGVRYHDAVLEVDRMIRLQIYLELAAGRRAPSASPDALRRLADAHLLVLDAAGKVRMAPPFSNVETAYEVDGGGTTWRATCAGDGVAIVRLLGLDEARVIDRGGDGRPGRTLSVTAGSLVERDGVISSPLPAARWWEDIVFT